MVEHTASQESSLLSEKFINLIMHDGKKARARDLFFEMATLVKTRLHRDLDKKGAHDTNVLDPIAQGIPQTKTIAVLLNQALENTMPSLEVRRVRIAGSTYLVPSMLSKKKQESIAMRWILEAARQRKKKARLGFAECLSEEILDALKKQGGPRQKRDELHRIAQINRAYSRYRWW
jgi:small subunit ribosomal protein S7